MSDYNDYNLFLHQMQSFRASDEARDQFVSVRRHCYRVACHCAAFTNTRAQDILSKYQILAREHATLKDDYSSEREIRRSYQRTVDEKQALVGEYERQLVGCPLLDVNLRCLFADNRAGRKFVRFGTY